MNEGSLMRQSLMAGRALFAPATHRKALLAATLLLLYPTLAEAQENSYKALSSEPEDLYVFGDRVYFTANDGTNGRELWRTDLEGNAELIKNITPGPADSVIEQFYAFHGRVYFRVQGPTGGWELWRTDGTEIGTQRFFGIEDAGSEYGVSAILNHTSSTLFFLVGPFASSGSLWATDGTPEGTREVSRSATGRHVQMGASQCGVLGEYLIFGGPPNHFELWRTDGTVAGTSMIRKMGWYSRLFMPLDEHRLLFTGDGGQDGSELWVTGGTPETTMQLKDIYPGSESSEPAHYRPWVSEWNPTPRMVFAATRPEDGREIWVSDGTSEGTQLLLDFYPGAGSSEPYSFFDAGASIYFLATREKTGKEWWCYNEETGGEHLIADIYPGLVSSDPYAPSRADGNRIFFSANNPELGEEWWVIRGGLTAHSLGDLYAGPTNSSPYYTVVLEGIAVAAATDRTHGRELWAADNNRSWLLADIYSDASTNPASSPANLTPAGAFLFFTANDIANGNELWRTDGTTAGTQLVKDIFPGEPSSNPASLTAVGELLYFTAEDARNGVELWQSDGTERGTALVMDIAPNASSRPRNLTELNGTLIFSAWRELEGEELWCIRPDRKPAILKNIREGSEGSAPTNFVVWKDFVYFQADDGKHGAELWRTDGTTEGTIMVRDIIEAPYESLSLREVREMDGQLYFVSDFEGRGIELYAMEDTGGNIRLVRDIATADIFDVGRK